MMRLSWTLPNSVCVALWVLHVLEQAINKKSKLKSRRQARRIELEGFLWAVRQLGVMCIHTISVMWTHELITEFLLRVK